MAGLMSIRTRRSASSSGTIWPALARYGNVFLYSQRKGTHTGFGDGGTMVPRRSHSGSRCMDGKESRYSCIRGLLSWSLQRSPMIATIFCRMFCKFDNIPSMQPIHSIHGSMNSFKDKYRRVSHQPASFADGGVPFRSDCIPIGSELLGEYDYYTVL